MLQIRPLLPLIVPLLLLLAGCASNDKIEVRTHALAPGMDAEVATWSETIQNTVAPERWNAGGSPHRLTVDGRTLTIRTTKQNHEAIVQYLATQIENRRY
jgi:hypothetical protein